MDSVESRVRHRSVPAASTRISNFSQFHLLGWDGMEGGPVDQEVIVNEGVGHNELGDPGNIGVDIHDNSILIDATANMPAVAAHGEGSGLQVGGGLLKRDFSG